MIQVVFCIARKNTTNLGHHLNDVSSRARMFKYFIGLRPLT